MVVKTTDDNNHISYSLRQCPILSFFSVDERMVVILGEIGKHVSLGRSKCGCSRTTTTLLQLHLRPRCDPSEPDRLYILTLYRSAPRWLEGTGLFQLWCDLNAQLDEGKWCLLLRHHYSHMLYSTTSIRGNSLFPHLSTFIIKSLPSPHPSMCFRLSSEISVRTVSISCVYKPASVSLVYHTGSTEVCFSCSRVRFLCQYSGKFMLPVRVLGSLFQVLNTIIVVVWYKEMKKKPMSLFRT